MIWWQSECKQGDMIRISFGNFYHYGIFVSEEEVIQFGLPPFDGLLNRKFEDIAVCVSDIDTFSGGRAVEVASIEKLDKVKRLSPKKTVQRARERIGEKGYDILHNNCEHFARYCYLGEKRCEVTEGVVNAWRNKTICDVYFSVIPEEIEYAPLQPQTRDTEVSRVTDEATKRAKYWAWKTLEYALFRSFGYKIQDLDIVKTKHGKWTAKNCFFSISHSGNAVAIIVSNKQTGIDIEDCESFFRKMSDEKIATTFTKKILAKKEEIPKDKTELLDLWTKKECLFKAGSKGTFIPRKIFTVDQEVSTLHTTYEGKDYAVSMAVKDKDLIRFYSYDGKSAVKYKDIKWL